MSSPIIPWMSGKRRLADRFTAATAPAINLLRIEENLSAAWQRLSGTYVENLPWLECAERYDRPHTFRYMELTGRPLATAWTSRLKTTSAWLILCGAVKGR